uniref:Uncharacterized protein n=1 Tax=Oryza nivara TaxID=4536 RepID=A0A0E0GMQ9_ORYNI
MLNLPILVALSGHLLRVIVAELAIQATPTPPQHEHRKNNHRRRGEPDLEPDTGVDRVRRRSSRPDLEAGQPNLATPEPEPRRAPPPCRRRVLAVPPPSSPHPRRGEMEPREMAPPPPSQRVAQLCRRRAMATAKQGGGRRRGGGG